MKTKKVNMKNTISIFMCSCLMLMFSVVAYSQGKFDREMFLKEAASDGKKEVKLAQMVQKNVEDQQVKEFAQMLERDHKNANERLKQLAEKKGWSLPNEMIDKHEDQVDEMEDLSGDELKRKYVMKMAEGHQKVVDKFKEAKKSAQDEELKKWIAETLPALEKHLERAKELAKSMG